MTWYADLPWHFVRDTHRAFRKYGFTKPRPRGRYIRVSLSEFASVTAPDIAEQIKRILGARHWHPNWVFSYNYEGEDLNLARPVMHRAGGLKWFQTHVRGFVDEAQERIDLSAHFEPAPTEHPKAHLRCREFSKQRGMDELGRVLNDAGVDHEVIQYHP